MIPAKSDPIWKKLVTGEKKHEFSCLPAGLMLSRIRTMMSSDSSPAALAKHIDDLHAFFVKHESILANDLKQLN